MTCCSKYRGLGRSGGMGYDGWMGVDTRAASRRERRDGCYSGFGWPGLYALVPRTGADCGWLGATGAACFLSNSSYLFFFTVLKNLCVRLLGPILSYPEGLFRGFLLEGALIQDSGSRSHGQSRNPHNGKEESCRTILDDKDAVPSDGNYGETLLSSLIQSALRILTTYSSHHHHLSSPLQSCSYIISQDSP